MTKRILSLSLSIAMIVISIIGLWLIGQISISQRPENLHLLLEEERGKQTTDTEMLYFSALEKTYDHLDIIARRDVFWRQSAEGLLGVTLAYSVLQILLQIGLRTKASNHGLESTSAPPAAGTLETHP